MYSGVFSTARETGRSAMAFSDFLIDIARAPSAELTPRLNVLIAVKLHYPFVTP